MKCKYLCACPRHNEDVRFITVRISEIPNLIKFQNPFVFNDIEPVSAFCNYSMKLNGLTKERLEFPQRRQDFKFSLTKKISLIYLNDSEQSSAFLQPSHGITSIESTFMRFFLEIPHTQE